MSYQKGAGPFEPARNSTQHRQRSGMDSVPSLPDTLFALHLLLLNYLASSAPTKKSRFSSSSIFYSGCYIDFTKVRSGKHHYFLAGFQSSAPGRSPWSCHEWQEFFLHWRKFTPRQSVCEWNDGVWDISQKHPGLQIPKYRQQLWILLWAYFFLSIFF